MSSFNKDHYSFYYRFDEEESIWEFKLINPYPPTDNEIMCISVKGTKQEAFTEIKKKIEKQFPNVQVVKFESYDRVLNWVDPFGDDWGDDWDDNYDDEDEDDIYPYIVDVIFRYI